MNTHTHKKPVVILCLDEPLISEVTAALPAENFTIIAANEKRYCTLSGSVKDLANAELAMQKLSMHISDPGFIISDENTSSTMMSGREPIMAAREAGWYTVMRTATNRSGSIRTLVDRYLTGEIRGHKANAQDIAQFIKERVDATGKVIPREDVRRSLAWEEALEERIYNSNSLLPLTGDEKQKVLLLVRALLADMDENKNSHPDIRAGLAESPAKERETIKQALDTIIGYVQNGSVRGYFFVDDNRDLARLEEKAKIIANSDLLKELVANDPHDQQRSWLAEIESRDKRGDEPRDGPETFAEQIRKKFSGINLESREVVTSNGASQVAESQLSKTLKKQGSVSARGGINPDFRD